MAKAKVHGYCTVCSTMQGVSEHNTLGFVVDYHMHPQSGAVCEGFSQPTQSIVRSQGASSSPRDHEFESPSSELLGPGDDDYPPDEEAYGNIGPSAETWL